MKEQLIRKGLRDEDYTWSPSDLVTSKALGINNIFLEIFTYIMF